MTEFSLAHSYTFRWEDTRRKATLKKQARHSFWFAIIGLEIVLLLGLLVTYSFFANERVRLETDSREVSFTIAQIQEKLDSLSFQVATKHSPAELERVAKEMGYVNPASPSYLSI